MRGGLNDLKGRRIGKLTVIKRVENDKYGNALWLCKCDCGNETKVVRQSLITETTKSCGYQNMRCKKGD